MTASTHKKIRKSNRFWVTKINKKGKQPLVAPAVVEDGPVLMASTTVGTQTSSSDYLFYKSGYSKNTRMSFIIDTAKNPDNSTDNTIIVPFTLYTPSYPFTIDWGDGSSTTYPANAALTTVGLTHTYSNAGQYTIVVTSDKQKIPVLNWSTSGNVGGNKHKLIQLSTPLITFDTACPNSNSAQYFAYECDNLLFIATQFFINNPHIRNYDYCFSKCSKLVKIPYDLFKYVKYQSSYQEVFAHDTALQTVPNDLFATAKAIDLGGAFSGDSNLILDVDLDTFFGTEPYINVDVHDIFRDCVKTTGDAVEFTKKFTEYVAYVIGTGTFDTGWGTLTGKIYAQPIYNSDGKLVRDLVPAKTGNFYGGRTAPQDCLYDEVNGEFLLPSSTFTYGTEKDVRDSYVFEGKTGEVGYTIVGSPTITEGMVSNFSSINYITVPAFSPSDNTWKIVTKFKLADTTTNQIIFSNNYQPNKQMQLSVQNSKLKVYISTNGTSSNLANGVFGTYTISVDTVYWVKFEFTGSAYIISYSVDGMTWTTDIIINSTETLINVSNNMFFGKNTHPNYPEPLTSGSILYLNDTYIEVNGKLWFGNQTQLVGCDENVYAQNTSKSYINTGITADSNTSLVINYKIDDARAIASGTRNWICGGTASYNQMGNFYAGFWQTTETNIYYWLNTSNKGAGTKAGSAFTDFSAKYRIELNGTNINTTTYLYKNDTTPWTYSNTAGEITQSGPITLFNRYSSISSGSVYFLGRIYDCAISKNNVLLQHLVPVPKGLVIGSYTIPSNGMFDIVEQKFYPNQGTGEFTIGGFNLDNIENNLPYSFKKNALYNCEQWSNFAIPESVWTGVPSSREDWLAVNEGKTNWLLTDSMNMLLLESANSNILCSPTDALKADMEALLSWYTGTMPEQVQGIIKPEPYESVDSLRNIINALPELRGYVVVGNPTIVDGVVSDFTTTDYIKTQSAPQDTDVRNYELFTKIRIDSIPTSTGFIMCYHAGAREGISIINDGRIRFMISRVPGTTGEPAIYSSACSAGDEVLIHTYYQGNNIWVLEISKDEGATWERNTLTVTSELSAMDTSRMFTIGGSQFYSAAYKSPFTTGSIDLNETYIKVNGKYWFDGTEKLNEVLDLSGCVNKGGLTSAELQTVINKGYTLVLN